MTKTATKPIAATTILEPTGAIRRVMGEYPRPLLKATPEMLEAKRAAIAEEVLRLEQIEEITREERERYMREDSVTLKRIKSRNGEEYERVEETRTTKIEGFKTRTDKLVLTTDNHTREIRKVATTVARLEKDGRLTRDLAIYLHTFAQRVAEGHGAATEDGDDSTSRLTASYEPTGGGGFGSKTPSDRQLNGLACLQEMRKRVPRELIPIFDQIVNEETTGWHDRKKTLSEIGEMIGYKHKQQSAAGGALVYAVCCLISHFVKENRRFTESRV